MTRSGSFLLRKTDSYEKRYALYLAYMDAWLAAYSETRRAAWE